MQLYWKDRIRRTLRRVFITRAGEIAGLIVLLALSVAWLWVLFETGSTILEWLSWTTTTGE
jgi:hypothetical protein